jgi:hypothetical protein
MGLLRGVARTAAVAGTATAVSNRVSRRQSTRWAAQEQQQAAAQQEVSEQRATAEAPRDDFDEKLDRLEKLGQLRTSGVLTQEEFQTQKATILTG